MAITNKFQNRRLGFTLAELLIALAILGVIATFTIPKILDSGSSSKHNAIAKEAAAMVSGAYQNFKLQNSVSGLTEFADMTQYMNYVGRDTVSDFDVYNNTAGSNTCTAVFVCLKLHNGAILAYNPNDRFGDSSTPTSVLHFMVDPDGALGGGTTGPSKTVYFYLYVNGRLRTIGSTEPNSYQNNNGTPALLGAAAPNQVPDYFSWGS